MHARRLLCTLFGVAALVAPPAGPAAAQGGQAVEVVMTDYAFSPNRLVLEAGKTYRLRVINRGANEHELMIGRGAMAMGGAEHGFMENLFEETEVAIAFEGGSAEAEGLVHVSLLPGTSVELTVNVPAGRRGAWELGCFVPGHYELGMRGSLTVR